MRRASCFVVRHATTGEPYPPLTGMFEIRLIIAPVSTRGSPARRSKPCRPKTIALSGQFLRDLPQTHVAGAQLDHHRNDVVVVRPSVPFDCLDAQRATTHHRFGREVATIGISGTEWRTACPGGLQRRDFWQRPQGQNQPGLTLPVACRQRRAYTDPPLYPFVCGVSRVPFQLRTVPI